MHIVYRDEIDGLRAIAIIPVVFFHAGFEIFSGGFLGVDVFFVISGYLITTIILKELNNNKFSIINFYERRARRILPELVFVIFTSIILSFIFLSKSELGSFFKSVNATLLLYSNFYFWKTAPYFKSQTDLEPLLHTWSLSIEEQFYIFFPIILFGIYKFLKKYILIFLFSAFIFSIFFCQILASNTSGIFNFYSSTTRAWELLMGSLTAYYLLKYNFNISNNLKNLFSIIGSSLIVFSIFFFDKETLHPSLYTLIPTFGTVLIIVFANGNTLVKKILSIKILVYIGLVSYSFYLWHQPLLAYGKIYLKDFTNELKFLFICLSLFLSFFSFNFVEKIFRNNKIISSKFLFCSLIPVIIFLLTLSYLSKNFFSSDSKNGTEAYLARLLSTSEAVYEPKLNERYFIKYRILHETLDPKNLIIGSSRLMQVNSKINNDYNLNLSVSGASIEDHIAITGMALNKFNPNTILLGADPWLFNKFNNQVRWKSLSKEYNLTLENIKNNNDKNKIINFYLNENKFSFFEIILNNTYKFLNIRNLKLDLKNDNIINNESAIILRNGMRIYGKKDRTGIYNDRVISYSLEKYEFSDEKYKIYKEFIQYLKNFHNKNVILVLSPYNQNSYDLTLNTKPFFQDLEKSFLNLAKEIKISIIGSYNPKIFNCYRNDFYDYQHPKEVCMSKIINQIK